MISRINNIAIVSNQLVGTAQYHAPISESMEIIQNDEITIQKAVLRKVIFITREWYSFTGDHNLGFVSAKNLIHPVYSAFSLLFFLGSSIQTIAEINAENRFIFSNILDNNKLTVIEINANIMTAYDKSYTGIYLNTTFNPSADMFAYLQDYFKKEFNQVNITTMIYNFSLNYMLIFDDLIGNIKKY